MKGTNTIVMMVVLLMLTARGYAVEKGSKNTEDKGSMMMIPIDTNQVKGAMEHEMKGTMDTMKESMDAMKDSMEQETKDTALPVITTGKNATVSIRGTQPQSPINGSLIFVEKDNGIQVDGFLYNVPNPGLHGLHIHEFGSCDEQGNAAGGHFNPKGVHHGYLPKDGMEKAHAGDMGNIDIDKTGQGSFSVFLSGLSLSTSGTMNVMGKAIILHEKADDFGQPTGNTGGRIACGVITVTKE